MQSWRVPLSWRNQSGPVSDINDSAHPFMQIELAQDRGGREDNWTRTLAMVDTGSSYSLISPKYLTEIGATQTTEKEMSGNWSKAMTPFYRLCIRAVGAEPFILCTEVGALSVDLDEGECLAVLGMDFLRFGRLSIEGLLGDSYFELHVEKIRRAQGGSSRRDNC